MNETSKSAAAPLLARLGIAADNPGACLGPNLWRGGGPSIASENPTTGAPLARVRLADAADLDV
ncbi:MAG TPA: hypothetical protein VET86_03070, partial [Casimicrobiaceae bacterium]|nr:hypothetical protein [Casimicrobiaceae bacterium]